MYFKLIKRTPVEYGTDLSEEIAVANRQKDLIAHLRSMCGRIFFNCPPIDADYIFEREFGCISDRPPTEPYYEIEVVKDGLIIVTTNDI